MHFKTFKKVISFKNDDLILIDDKYISGHSSTTNKMSDQTDENEEKKL